MTDEIITEIVVATAAVAAALIFISITGYLFVSLVRGGSPHEYAQPMGGVQRNMGYEYEN